MDVTLGLKTPVIGIDIDDCLYSLVKLILPYYNKAYNDNVRYEDITDYRIQMFLKSECENVFKEFCKGKIFKDVVFESELVNALTQLNAVADVYFVTATHPKCVKAKDKMLSRNLSWYSSSQLIVCRNKAMLNLDYMIDDNIDNVNRFTQFKPSMTSAFLVAAPWNQNAQFNPRKVKRCRDATTAIQNAYAMIKLNND